MIKVLRLAGGLGLAALALACDASGSIQPGSFRLAQVDRGDIHAVVTVAGPLIPVGEVEVGSQVSGRIAELLVDFNDQVAAGQVIARIDPEAFEAQLRRAQAGLRDAEAGLLMGAAGLRQAEASLAVAGSATTVVREERAAAEVESEEASRALGRIERLEGDGIVSSDEVEEARAKSVSLSALLRARLAEEEVQLGVIQGAEANVEVAHAELSHAGAVVAERRAALEEAEVALSRTEIRSPIDGVVIDRRVAPGQTVAASLEAPVLFKIARSLSEMEIHAKVDEADVSQIRVGQRAGFSVASNLNLVFQAHVVQVRKAPQILDNVVAYTVVLLAENSSGSLLPGMTAIVDISIHEARDVVRVPREALDFRPRWIIETNAASSAGTDSRRAGGSTGRPQSPLGKVRSSVVWRLKNGRPKAVEIQVGAIDAHSAELVSGDLGIGETVIVAHDVND